MNLKTRLTNWTSTIIGTIVFMVAAFLFFEIITPTLIWHTIVEMLAMFCGVVLIFSRL